MAEFLLAAAAFILATVAVGLVGILLGPADAERMLTAQLLGTGGVASLLLMGVAIGVAGTIDLAVMLVLLAAFGSVAFVAGTALRALNASDSTPPGGGHEEPADR